ncbi:MFS transporter [Pseudomonas typographi]|uniref:MFS transporter n=1 Tax=Pseudomonas typographi TaxID=2715964 RepID=UPI001686E60D|nr:MFS transporter [Pseudomonas typographi]MBD1589335.1 MFS transporter [Pseudomonas typographi]
MTQLSVGIIPLSADRLERLPICGFHRWLFAIIALAFFFDNIDLATMGFLLGSIKTEFGLTSAQAGLLASASFVGMAAGALMSGALADRFGRKLIFQTSMIIWGAASYLCSIAPDATWLAIFRALLGVGMGMETPLAQTLLSEFVPAKSRGKYLALMEGNWPIAFICAGVLSDCVLWNYDWRTVFFLEAIPAFFVLCIRWVVPESPRWLDARGRHAEAAAIMDRIEKIIMRRLKVSVLPTVAITASPAAQAEKGHGGLRALISPAYRKRTVMISGLWFFALLGFYGLNTWLGALLQQSGLDVTKSVLFTVYISLGGIPGFLSAAWAIERWGRKVTCLVTLVGATVGVYVFGQTLSMSLGGNISLVAGAMMQFFVFGIWCILYAYTPELYPSRARASACGFASFCGRIGALLGPTIIGIIIPMSNSMGPFIFGAVCFTLAALVVFLYGVETKSSSLEEIST